MIDILSEVVTGVTIGVASVSGAVIVGLVVKHSLSKVLTHVDDTAKHVDPDNGYVRNSLCVERLGHINKQFEEYSDDMKIVHKRIDTLVEVQVKNTDRIISEIKKNK